MTEIFNQSLCIALRAMRNEIIEEIALMMEDFDWEIKSADEAIEAIRALKDKPWLRDKP